MSKLYDKALYERMGNNIRVLREKRGLDRETLAEMVGVSPGTMRTVEEGKKTTRFVARHLGKICEVLMVLPDDLLYKEFT